MLNVRTLSIACIVTLALLWLTGCGSGGQQVNDGSASSNADLSAYTAVTSSEGDLVGHGVFSRGEDGHVRLMLVVDGAAPGAHDVYIRERGGCDGLEEVSPAGDGDFGRVGHVEVDPSGQGFLAHATPDWTIGTGKLNDILGRAIVLHPADSDPEAAPSRSCGIIKSSQSHTVALYGVTR